MKQLSLHGQEKLAALRAKAAHRREYLKILELELFNTRAALQEFTQEYSRRVGPFETELQRLEQLLEGRLEEDEPPRAAPNGHRRSGGHTSANGPSHNQTHTGDGEEMRNGRTPARRNPNFERKIRELFRNLAKRFHPDLANEPEEKKRREQIMSKINQAYSAKDLGTLQELARHSAQKLNGKGGIQSEITQLEVELRHLDAMIFEVEHTIRELDLSPAMQLRSEALSEERAGRDLFADLELNLKERIAELREHLLDLGVERELVLGN